MHGFVASAILTFASYPPPHVCLQLAASTKRDTSAALDTLQHDLSHDLQNRLKAVDSKLELHESKMQTLAESLTATRGQVIMRKILEGMLLLSLLL